MTREVERKDQSVFEHEARGDTGGEKKLNRGFRSTRASRLDQQKDGWIVSLMESAERWVDRSSDGISRKMGGSFL